MANRDVEEADWLARVRTGLFLMLALVFILSGFVARPEPEAQPGGWAFSWGILAVLMMANLTGIGRGGILHRPAVRRLLEDETTREHRRTGQAAGFWAAMASALILWVTGHFVAIPAQMALRVVVTAGVSAALIGFAVQEWLAIRHG